MRKAIALLCAVALAAGGLYALGLAAAPEPTYQGDHLGMEPEDTPEEYLARVGASIREDAPPSFALVSFERESSFEAAAAALRPAGRVSAIVFDAVAPRAVPEPTGGEDRADVFAREARRLAASGEKRDGVIGAVVYAPGEELARIRGEAGVFAVEALPADAAWGSFAIAPVRPQ
ncbi:hypothetical protein [Corynebacterium liangguodongii]|uniref:Uncharacterized protein n=1 Tax=Corynebacterium liangguodongii TaxID=2079535 RepID=A0A2S0WEY9_9CORY|nr:hypothetical protein [Corynebacterium liangguodongii]AWB84338.1 hypothetical protein C3E79_07460 [Corynebacterium liangguodongii]PWB99828.1 hypothetical protein DF219_04055 [Corynebacterium liangguodongii]